LASARIDREGLQDKAIKSRVFLMRDYGRV
jgi:hypothetical protein